MYNKDVVELLLDDSRLFTVTKNDTGTDLYFIITVPDDGYTYMLANLTFALAGDSTGTTRFPYVEWIDEFGKVRWKLQDGVGNSNSADIPYYCTLFYGMGVQNGGFSSNVLSKNVGLPLLPINGRWQIKISSINITATDSLYDILAMFVRSKDKQYRK